ncbi:TonB-dependent receptor [Sphingomonas prati]|uniref:Outer membrane receptor protein involved in Fe transport n=1 Tax=Sphingomonas prati TaxID=1843237 RepID=A0A7W9F135_9SPHN|nr:TonB-dependent receptor [Sphingomonas prati]MBB5728898.1 outer membrane receptor protein involved in Fe transport [Sphingomonas prati]GGE86700.1 TonB-dependent receptor [Sphingomonas prati]
MRKALWLLSTCIVTISAPAMAQDNSGTLPASPANTTRPAGTGTEAGAVQLGGTAGAIVPADPASPAASGVNDPNSPNYDPSTIVITATRRASPLSDVPIAVTAVTAASLQNSGATDIRQLNQLAPSLLVSSTGSEANGSARIRGIGTVGDNPGLESSVAVFIDGVYRSRTGSGLNELGEIERVEVLRGPQGTLFGRNASAGLINIVSKKPSFTQEGYGEATYGNYDFLRLSGGISGPIGKSGIAYRLDGIYVKRDGFYKNVTQGGDSESRINDRNRYFVRGQLLYEPSDDFSVRLIGDYSRRNESCCGAVFVATRESVDPTANPASATGGVNTDGASVQSATNRIVDILNNPYFSANIPTQANLDPYNREVSVTPGRTYKNLTTDWGGSAQFDWDLGPGTLTSITAYRQYKAGGAADVDYTAADLVYRGDDSDNYRQFKTFSQEARFQGSAFSGVLDFLVGGYYSNEKLRLVDNIKFGTQYGQFAACRIVATISPVAALRAPGSPGCLSAAGRATLTGAFGAAAPTILRGIDNLGTISDKGDNRAVYNQRSENYAFFTHNIINITDTLSVTLGARYTNETKKFDANFNNDNTICPTQQALLGPLLANPALGAIAGGIVTLSCQGNSSPALNALNLNSTRKEDEFTGTGVLSWKPTARVLTYASYSKGYKAGGFNLDRSALGGANGVFSPRTNADADGLQFEPEKVDAYEIGAKYSSRHFNLNVAAFRQEFKTFQLNTFNGSIFIVQNIAACKTSLNGGDTDNSRATGTCTGGTKAGVISQGVEVEAALFPVRDFQVSAGYTYADTHYRRNLVGSSSGVALDPALFLLSGRQMSNSPKNVVTVSATWTPELTSSGIHGLVYADTRMTSAYNTGSDLFPEKAQEGFAVVNARIGLRGPANAWALELWGQNIFDKQYQQVAFNAPFQGANSVAQTQAFGVTANQLFASYLAEPRTFGVTARTKF